MSDLQRAIDTFGCVRIWSTRPGEYLAACQPVFPHHPAERTIWNPCATPEEAIEALLRESGVEAGT